MTTFERVKAMLDAMYPGLPGDRKAAVRTALGQLTAAYPNIWTAKVPPIDYSSAAVQTAYVFRYVTANADLIYQTLWNAREVAAPIFQKDRPWMACLGGGPGSEILAARKFMQAIRSGASGLGVDILDHHPTWSAVWPHTTAACSDLEVSLRFTQMDYGSLGSWFASQEFLGADVFTFSYSLSEAWR